MFDDNSSELKGPSLPRRQFLKLGLAGLGATAAGFASDNFSEPSFQNILLQKTMEGLGTKEGQELLFMTAGHFDKKSRLAIEKDPRSFPKESLLTPNPNLRRIDDLISETIQDYQTSGGTVTYDKDPNFKSLSWWSDKIRQHTAIHLQSRNPLSFDNFSAAMHSVMRKNDTSHTFSASQYGFDSFSKMRIPGSGLHRQTSGSTENPDEVVKNWLSSNLAEIDQQIIKAGGGPVSTSVVFRHFLSKNGGNIRESLWDTTILLKALARNELTTAAQVASFNKQPDRLKEIVTSFSSRFIDEFSLSADYTQLSQLDSENHEVNPEDKNLELSSLNRIGIYHVWNQAALLASFPAELVAAGTIERQLDLLKSFQGYAKIAMDILATIRLKPLETLLHSQGSIITI